MNYANLVFRYFSRSKKSRWLLYTTTLLAGSAGGAMYYEPGLRRSAYFWVRVLPIFFHYKYVEWKTKDLSEEESQKAFTVLHNKYSSSIERYTLQLGGFYLKCAQIISTLDHFLPPEYLTWCKKLQDEVATVITPKEIRNIVEKDMGKKIDDVFSHWNDIPRGCASIGQVHYAVLKNGKEVAVKIQYPGIENKFRADIRTLRAFCRFFMPFHLPTFNEIEKQFRSEFDYIAEGKNLELIANNIMPVWGNKVVIPRPVLGLCSRNLLVMDYLHGERLVDGIRNSYQMMAKKMGKTLEELENEQREKIKIEGLKSVRDEKYKILLLRLSMRLGDYFYNSLRVLYNFSFGWLFRNKPYQWSKLPLNLAEIIEVLHHVHAHEIFIDGTFNGDPHPGNILLLPDGRLGLIDYGQVKHIDLQTRLNYAKLMLALAKDDKSEVVDIFINRMKMKGKYGKTDVVYRVACFWNDRQTQDVLGNMNIPQFLDWAQEQDPVVSINDEYVLLGRVAVLLRGMGNAFGLHLRTSLYWKPYAERLLKLHGEFS